MTPHLRMRLLGEFRLDEGERAIQIDHLSRSFLAYLVLHRNVSISRQQVAFLFWPDSTDGQARTNLRKLLFRCRKTLPQFDELFETTGQRLRWRKEASLWLDVAEFERLLGLAKEAQGSGEQRAQREALSEALALYGGDLWPDCYEDWILPLREGLREGFMRALSALILLCEAERDYAGAIRYAQRLLRVDELREQTYRVLMRLHAANGHPGAALRVYHACVTVLEDELGVPPSSATRKAHERLLKIQRNASQPPLAQASFVGRHAEWAQLQAAWQAAQRGEPKVVLITGEAGIGKTRLAEEVVRWVKRQGFATASAHCYATAGELAYLPVAAWLRTMLHQGALSTLPDFWLSQIARLLPELLIQRPDLEPPKRLKASLLPAFYQALVEALLARSGQPLLLFLDDLQWADSQTLVWLPYLLHQTSPLLLVVTMRSEEMSENVSDLLYSWRRSGQLSKIALPRLNERDTIELASKVSQHHLPPTEATCLYHETEGNPLFVVEMVRAAQEAHQSRIKRPTEPSGSVLPAKLTSVIDYRLAQLSPSARKLADLLGVIGRAFSFELLVEVCQDSEEEVVQRLDELWQKRLIRSQNEENEENEEYDFTHDKIRTVTLSKLSPIRRRFLHRKVATALERLHEGNLEAVAGQIASHYEAAGKKQAAIPYYQQAIEATVRIYANQEALSYLNCLLTILSQQATKLTGEALSENRRLQCEALFKRIHIFSLLMDATARTRDFAEVTRLATLLDDKSLLANARYQEAKLFAQGGEYDKAQQLLAETIHLSQEGGNRFREATASRLLGQIMLATGEYAAAESAFCQSLPIFSELDEAPSEVHSLCALSTLYLRMGEPEQAIAQARQALCRCQEANLPYRRRIPLGDIGAAAIALGEYDLAHQSLTESLTLGRQVNDRTQETFCLGHLGWLAVQRDEATLALTHLQAAQDLAHQSHLRAYQSWLDSGLAHAYRLAEKPEEAIEHATRALEVAEARGQPFDIELAREALAEVAGEGV